MVVLPAEGPVSGPGAPPEVVEELRCTTVLALCATKQTAVAIDQSMVAMVVTERHLWVNLANIREEERNFLLDALILPVWHIC